MPSLLSLSPSGTFLCVVVLVICFSSTADAFGAGNIASLSSIEGQNWRHGDIEDTLLNIFISRAAGGKKFSKLDVKRVYFGNWLRDYSQAVDVGTVKYVSAEAIRLILWVLGFMSFGYGTKEFEVTFDRLGCYRPEEHIDNPKDYADNLDARQYDRRLRGPVDERRELAINPDTGLKNYIATENMGIDTSAALVRKLFGRSIELGRRYARTKNDADLFEALRLLGTGCHCLEDYSAHSNYTELALIELGETSTFPHVGRRTQMRLPGAHHPVYPIITGTFGGVDFLHSVMGEFSDKATQSELQDLTNTCESSQNSGNTSVLQDLLNQVPSGLFGGGDQAGKVDELQANATAAQMQQTHITPKEPEAWTRSLQEVSKQIYPILEWHDELIKNITETIEKIPVLPQLIEQVQDQINLFVFSLIAPFIIPIVNQVKTELATGSSEIIQSSKEKQLVVFRDDYSTDPTHSMLSKDHFSNILNEPAGKVASQVLKWVVPQLIACWDDERIDVNRTLDRIVHGIFHHPAQRDMGDDGAVDGRRGMFMVVQTWWSEKSEEEKYTLRDQLSREGVEEGRNHKEGVQDGGHGCGKPLGMPTAKTASSSGAIGGLAGGLIGGNVLGQIGDAFAGQSEFDEGASRPSGPVSSNSGIGKFVEDAAGGGAFGGIVGGIAGGIGADLLGDVLGGGGNVQRQNYESQSYGRSGEYTQSYTETGYTQSSYGQPQRYGQAEFSQTSYPSGGQREEYQQYTQEGQFGRQGYGEQIVRETRPTYGGAYEERVETRFERPGGEWESEVRREEFSESFSGGRVVEDTYRSGRKSDDSDSDSDSSKKRRKAEKKRLKELEREQERREEYGEDRREDEYISERQQGYGGGGGGYVEERREEHSRGYGGGEYVEEDRFREESRGNRGYGGGEYVEEDRFRQENRGDRGYGEEVYEQESNYDRERERDEW